MKYTYTNTISLKTSYGFHIYLNDEKNQLTHHLHQWLDKIRRSDHLTNKWSDADLLYNNFSLFMIKSNNEHIKYNIFLIKLNKIQSYIGFIYKTTNQCHSGNRIVIYLIYNDKSPSNFERLLQTLPRTNNCNIYNCHHNDMCHPITPSDNRHNRDLLSISHIFNMSVSMSQNHSIPVENIQHKVAISNQLSTYPVLHKYAISLDFRDSANILSLQSIISELELLDKEHDLFLQGRITQ